MSTVEETYERLKKVNEPKGYFLNTDRDLVDELIKGILKNKERYGYGSCPCRLASGSREADKDIICPCDYREPDVQEYGTCYCALYCSKDWIDGVTPHVTVPERRPPEKFGWGTWPDSDA